MTGLDAQPLLLLMRLQPTIFETPAVLKKIATASRQLAELKGLAASMPNQAILINTLGLQEAKDSSAIENIVTTHDELFRSATYPDLFASPAAEKCVTTSRPSAWVTTRCSRPGCSLPTTCWRSRPSWSKTPRVFASCPAPTCKHPPARWCKRPRKIRRRLWT